MYYALFKQILFRLDPEKAHYLALKSLNLIYRLKLSRFFFPKPVSSLRSIMGLTFANPVGLAAGFDKNGDYIDALASLGFGFIEVGTITPKPQEGNPRPRLFRLSSHEAIINRLGFNNKGVDYLVEQLKKMQYQGILGVNLGKNRDTPLDQAVNDYIYSFRRIAPYASYITINISSPNTPELRNLQHGELLKNLLQTLKKEQSTYQEKNHKYLPLVVKISPDLTEQELTELANTLIAEKIDGVIATNTTLSRLGVEDSPLATETGGLSGKPLSSASTELIKKLHDILQGRIPIIASGGVMSEKIAQQKMAAGAKLIQVYSGLIYQGPRWLKELINSLD